MDKFKAIVSNHSFEPVRFIIMFYTAWFLYAAWMEEDFKWGENAVLMIVFLIVYVAVIIFSSLLSFNREKYPSYELNGRIEKYIAERIETRINALKTNSEFQMESNCHIKGVYNSDIIPQNNPKEFYAELNAFSGVLYSVGSLSSDKMANEIKEYMKNLQYYIKNLEDEEWK